MADNTIFGMFRQHSEAEGAIAALRKSGFDDERISVAMRDRQESRNLQDDTGTEAAEGAATGAVAGGTVGGALGLLAGLGAIAIPGIGPIVAAGWLGSTLVGAGAGAAAGGIIGGLAGMGVPDEDARRFDTSFREGGILVAVDAGSRTDEAAAILRSRGADVSGRDIVRPVATAGNRSKARNAYGGRERRRSTSTSYSGPERRQARL